MSLVRVEPRESGVALLTLDAPERRNTLSPEMVDDIIAALDDVEQEQSGVSAVVVSGAPPAFCAGADLSALRDLEGGSTSETGLRNIYEAFLRFARSPLLTVAAVNGAAVGAGMNLALACDLRIVARSARFISRFLEIGLHPGGGHTWMLQRLVGPQLATEMVLCGKEVSGESLVEVGLAVACAEDDTVVHDAVALAERAVDVPRPLLTRVKDTLRRTAAAATLDEAVSIELEAQIWSSSQPEFAERLAAMRSRVTKRGS